MKKLIAIILTIITLFGVASAEIYPATMRVIEVNYTEDTVTVEDFNGFTYTFEGCEDFMVGDGCALIMDDNGTEKIFDDEIIMCHYCGWNLINWYKGE